MQKVDLLVKCPHIYTMAGAGVGYLGDGAFAVDRGKILAIGPSAIVHEFLAERVIDLKDHAVFPGLIDAHMHTPWCVLRGLAQDTGYWMMYGLGPFSEKTTPESTAAGSRLAFIEAMRVGTTTFGDFGHNMDPICRFIEKAGVRGHIATTVREAVPRIYKPGELYDFDENLGKKLLADNLHLYDKWHNAAGGRISVLFGPQGADFASKQMLLEVRRLAKERNTRIHLHLAQGDRETAQTVMRYGKRPIPWLDEIGYLDSSLMGVHLTDATEEEASLVARRGASMILCSGSIGIIDGIVPPAKAFQDAGGYVALGSDQAPGNNCHSIINEMKLTALFNKIRYSDPEVMPAWKVLRMATIEGARAIGLDERIGSLEPGKCADFIAINLKRPTMMPLYLNPMRNIVPNLVYSARGDEVDLVVVNGRVIVEDGCILTVDEAGVLNDVQRYANAIGESASETFWRINGTNAQFMKQDRL